jgi:hypothetical protein
MERGPQRPDVPPAEAVPSSLDGCGDGRGVGEAGTAGRVNHVAQPVKPDHTGAIGQRAGRRGHRNARDDEPIEGREGRSVDPTGQAPAAGLRRQDDVWLGGRRAEAVDGGRREVGHDRARWAGQAGGQRPLLPCRLGRGRAVQATAHGDPTAGAQPVFDLPGRQPGSSRLFPRDEAVVSGREPVGQCVW